MVFFGLAETAPGSGLYAITSGAPTHAFQLLASGVWAVAELDEEPMNVLYINGTDVGTLGLDVQDAGAWLSGLVASRGSVPIPDGFGSMASGVDTLRPRADRIRLLIKTGVTLSTREAVLDRVRDLLQGVVEVRWSGSERKLLCSLESDAASAFEPVLAFDRAETVVQWDLVAYQGVRIDGTDRVVGFTTTPGTVQVGTHFGQGVMWISGSATTPVVTYKDFRGDTVGTMTFATLAADEALEVDLYAGRVYLHDAGVRTLSQASLTASSGGFFRFEPRHANVSVAAYPTLEVSSGNGLLLHRRVWRG